MLGAGGAARCVIHAVLDAGAREVRVFNRTRDRADVVAHHFGSRVKPHDWRDRIDRSRDAGLLINATSLGMHGAADLDMPVEQLADDCVVADLVYVPLLTPLLAAALMRGLVTVDGLGMLLHQATPGFEKWFGVAPEVTDELRSIIVADIEGR
jgi:shikimate dehydrogenase